MEMASWDPTRKDSCWLCAGMPVMGSRRVFSCAMLHAGEILRSDDEFADAIIRGTSAALWRDMLMEGAPLLLLQDELVRQLVIGGQKKVLRVVDAALERPTMASGQRTSSGQLERQPCRSGGIAAWMVVTCRTPAR